MRQTEASWFSGPTEPMDDSLQEEGEAVCSSIFNLLKVRIVLSTHPG